MAGLEEILSGSVRGGFGTVVADVAQDCGLALAAVPFLALGVW